MNDASPRLHEFFDATQFTKNSGPFWRNRGALLWKCHAQCPTLLNIEGLEQIDHAACVIDKSDPDPTPPENIRAGYGKSDVATKIRLHKSESCLLERLLSQDLKCVVQITGVESKEESALVYHGCKEKILPSIGATTCPASRNRAASLHKMPAGCLARSPRRQQRYWSRH